MSVADVVAIRGITEVLHFTTSPGALGILHTRSLLPTRELREDKRLEFIMKPNCSVRKDPDWTGHVSMSVSRINGSFFDICSNSWHASEDIFWCVLSFTPDILSHNAVYFATTNNIYPSRLRGTGRAGLEALFAPVVAGRYGVLIRRTPEMPLSHTTCEQAEVLYPGALSIRYLQRVYFVSQDHADVFHGQADALRVELDPSMLCVRPEVFNRTE